MNCLNLNICTSVQIEFSYIDQRRHLKTESYPTSCWILTDIGSGFRHPHSAHRKCPRKNTHPEPFPYSQGERKIYSYVTSNTKYIQEYVIVVVSEIKLDRSQVLYTKKIKKIKKTWSLGTVHIFSYLEVLIEKIEPF